MVIFSLPTHVGRLLLCGTKPTDLPSCFPEASPRCDLRVVHSLSGISGRLKNSRLTAVGFRALFLLSQVEGKAHSWVVG